jgi:hypothetical protein
MDYVPTDYTLGINNEPLPGEPVLLPIEEPPEPPFDFVPAVEPHEEEHHEEFHENL